MDIKQKKEIGERLREFGKTRFGTLTKFEEELGLAKGGLSQYTRGRNALGSNMIIKLKEMGCDIDWLLSGKGDDKFLSLLKQIEQTKDFLKKLDLTKDDLDKMMEDESLIIPLKNVTGLVKEKMENYKSDKNNAGKR